MYIGNVHLPAIKTFKEGDISRSTEAIGGLGYRGYVPAEFVADLPAVAMSGHLLQAYEGTRTLQQYAEDVEALSQRRVGHNLISSVKGHSGWVSVTGLDVDDEVGELWPVGITGKWYDKGEYVLHYKSNPVTLANDWDITGTYKLLIPPGYSPYSEETLVFDHIDVEDGTVSQIRDADIKEVRIEFTSDTTTGKCKCFDEVSGVEHPVYSTTHRFTGTKVHVSNGAYKVTFHGLFVYLKYWDGSSWQSMGTLSHTEDGAVSLTECTNDKIIIRKGQDITLEMEIARPPHFTNTKTFGGITAGDQTTTTDNYLTIGTNMYVCSDESFSIASGKVDAGDTWYFYAASDVVNVAHNCLCISNLKREVVSR